MKVLSFAMCRTVLKNLKGIYSASHLLVTLIPTPASRTHRHSSGFSFRVLWLFSLASQTSLKNIDFSLDFLIMKMVYLLGVGKRTKFHVFSVVFGIYNLRFKWVPWLQVLESEGVQLSYPSTAVNWDCQSCINEKEGQRQNDQITIGDVGTSHVTLKNNVVYLGIFKYFY